MDLNYPLDCVSILENKKKLKRKFLENNNFVNKRIAILSGSTIGDIAEIIELFLLKDGIRPDFYIGQFNRYYEEAVFTNKELEEFDPDIIYIMTTNKNIDEYPIPTASSEYVDELLEKEYSKFETVWEKIQESYNCPIIQNNFEFLPYRVMGNADIYMESGKNSFINRLNNRLYEYTRKHSDFHICDINYLSAKLGHGQWYNSSHWYAYKYALNIEAIPYLADNVAKIIKSILGKNKKAIICDLDNTLWGGIIGDDGIEGIELGMDSVKGMAYMDFQKYLKELKSMGVILTVCSKNDLKTAVKGLKHHDSLLDEDDFTIIKANWNEKHENIKEIIKELNITETGFVFLDDNPMEQDCVKSFLPDIAVPRLKDVFSYIEVLDNAGFFEVTGLFDEDIKRTDYYKENILRQNYRSEFKDYREYLKSLEMTCNISDFKTENFARVTQLINKTNQFNLTTRRYTLSDIQAFSADDKYITLCADLNDRFGNNGIVTALIGELIDKGTLEINLWVMSCRVFKRDLEYALFDALINQCKKNNITKIIGVFIETDKNNIVKSLYQDLGFELIKENNGYVIWEYNIPVDYENKNKVIEVK